MNSNSQPKEMSLKDWARRVWQVVSEIPRGHVLTYGDVARLSGAPGYARRVSQAMRWAPKDIKLPWHRVINSRGEVSLRKFGDGAGFQRELLEEEGVYFGLKGRVDLGRFEHRW